MPKDAGFCPSAVATTTPIKSDKSLLSGLKHWTAPFLHLLIRPLHACLTASQTFCRIFYPRFQVGNTSYRLDLNKGAAGYSGWVTGTLVEHQGEGIAPNQRNRSECKSLLVYWRSLCCEHCIYLRIPTLSLQSKGALSMQCKWMQVVEFDWWWRHGFHCMATLAVGKQCCG